MKENNLKIHEKVTELLNKIGVNKKTIKTIDKEKLKQIFKDVYKEFNTLSPFDTCANKDWREAALEVLKEEQPNNQENQEIKGKGVIDNEGNEKEDFKDDQSSNEDYDDLIQPEFPKKFCESFHNKKIENLIKKLEDERKEENECKEKYEDSIKKEIDKYLKESRDKQDFTDEDKDKKLQDIRKNLKKTLKKDIKNISSMKNNEFLLLLCLMRLKKETLYESNPYIVEFSVTLDSVYQSKKDEDTDEDRDLLNHFEEDLNKYVD